MMNAPMMMAPMPMPPQRSSKPTIAGVFCILGALVSILGLLVTLILASILGSFGMLNMFGVGGGVGVSALLGILGLVGGIMGAMFSFQRKNWMMALIGCILLLASLLIITGLIAVILVGISKKEFSSSRVNLSAGARAPAPTIFCMGDPAPQENPYSWAFSAA